MLSGTFKELINEIDTRNINFPCIAHVITLEGMSHFVVLTNMSKGKIELFDPGFGSKEISHSEFEKLWTGNLITFSKNNSNYLEKESKFKPFKKYITFFNQKFWTIVMITLASIVLSISSIAISYIYKIIIDKVILGVEDANKMETFSLEDGVTASYVGARQSRALTEGRYDFGYWVRGVSFGWRSYVISRYKSDNSQGHASVVNGQGLYRAGGWKSPGTFSSAELEATWSGNKAYYDWR